MERNRLGWRCKTSQLDKRKSRAVIKTHSKELLCTNQSYLLWLWKREQNLNRQLWFICRLLTTQWVVKLFPFCFMWLPTNNSQTTISKTKIFGHMQNVVLCWTSIHVCIKQEIVCKKRPKWRFWRVKFNGIMIAFVGHRVFNCFIRQKAQPEPLLHSLSQLKLSIVDTPSGQKAPKNHI